MLKKTLLFVITLLLVLTVSVGLVSADPMDSSDNSSVSSVSSENSSTESTESTESTVSTESNESVYSSSNNVSSNESKFYIKDDSDYYNASLNELGGNASTVVSGIQASGGNNNNNPPKKNIAGVEKFLKFIWIPIGIIALCALVLVCFNRVYKVKYEHIDPAAHRKKPSGNNSRSNSSGSAKPTGKTPTHRPRD